MRKIVPLLILFWCAVVNVYGQPPEFALYNASVEITEGISETLSAPTSGGAYPISYQWKKDGINIPGATGYSYMIVTAELSDAGTYTLVATNSAGSATATITVVVEENRPPSSVSISNPIPGMTFTPGTEFGFSGEGTDPDELWTITSAWKIEYHDNGNVTPVPIPYTETLSDGQFAGYFLIPADLVPSAAAFYRIRLTIKDQLNESLTTYVDVPWSGDLNTTFPEIDEHPISRTMPVGTALRFSVSARFATSYQWYHNEVAIPGATASTYQINSVQLSDAGTYYVDVANAAGVSQSNVATLAVTGTGAAPTFYSYKSSIATTEGLSYTLFAVAYGPGPITYQWQKDGSTISGATTSSYDITNALFSDAGIYTLTASNSNGIATARFTFEVYANSPPSWLVMNAGEEGKFTPGEQLSFWAEGNDPNSTSTLRFVWEVEYHDGATVTSIPFEPQGTPNDRESAGFVNVDPDLVPTPDDFFRVRVTLYDHMDESRTTYKDVTWSGNLNTSTPPTFNPYQAIVNTTEGFNVTLEAVATGPGPISYQWKKGATNIPGATSSSYTIQGVELSDAATYTLVATNLDGSATATITLEVDENLPPSSLSLNEPGPSITFTPGTELYFSAEAEDPNGWSTLRLVWNLDYHNGSTVTPVGITYLEQPGENESAGYSLISPDLTPSPGAFIRVRITVFDQMDESLTSYRDVPWSGNLNTNQPEIEEHPKNATVAAGSPVTFSVKTYLATSFQWAHNGTNIPGATSSSYTISSAQISDAGNYKVFVSNNAGTVESNVAVLTVTGSAPVITDQPDNVTAAEGSSASFQVAATGAISYQWTFEGLNIPGATSAAYTIYPVQFSHAGTYRVLITNAAGTTASHEAELTVVNSGLVVLKTNPANLSIVVDGSPVVTRYAVNKSLASQTTVSPVTPQTAGGVTYAFSNWAHGGAPTQTFTTMAQNTYHTINYSSPLTGAWRTTEVGSVNHQGSASYSGGTYTLSGAGNDIWNTIDAFRFVYQSYTGDVDIKARVTGLTNTHAWAKAGVMIRNSTDPRAKNVFTAITPSNGATFQRRADAGATTVATTSPASSPAWVRLVRSGNSFASYVSQDGTNWTEIGSQSISMNERVYIGLAVTSHNTAALATATFTNVSVSGPPAFAARSAAESSTFDVYPNPVSDGTLNVKFNGAKSRKLEIINLFGLVVRTQELNSESAVFDVNGLPLGVYTLRMTEGTQVQVRQFIKE